MRKGPNFSLIDLGFLSGPVQMMNNHINASVIYVVIGTGNGFSLVQHQLLSEAMVTNCQWDPTESIRFKTQHFS